MNYLTHPFLFCVFIIHSFIISFNLYNKFAFLGYSSNEVAQKFPKHDVSILRLNEKLIQRISSYFIFQFLNSMEIILFWESEWIDVFVLLCRNGWKNKLNVYVFACSIFLQLYFSFSFSCSFHSAFNLNYLQNLLMPVFHCSLYILLFLLIRSLL